ncbi:hypothetical protein GCK72_015879 [Caenorhabditis remanei]|uniref:Uncharacterized protein n=1 Tax=Caenorhabditis remanei TaxID=31234 RepID=A0A6A5GYN5_CAERE|nr:hypothetical protein GCK72_015879 [Caenorhabditis remanei]KAF1759412.1 hypothetical protein GCK72_015879 [Caenorhabditis remanei]
MEIGTTKPDGGQVADDLIRYLKIENSQLKDELAWTKEELKKMKLKMSELEEERDPEREKANEIEDELSSLRFQWKEVESKYEKLIVKGKKDEEELEEEEVDPEDPQQKIKRLEGHIKFLLDANVKTSRELKMKSDDLKFMEYRLDYERAQRTVADGEFRELKEKLQNLGLQEAELQDIEDLEKGAELQKTPESIQATLKPKDVKNQEKGAEHTESPELSKNQKMMEEDSASMTSWEEIQ